MQLGGTASHIVSLARRAAKSRLLQFLAGGAILFAIAPKPASSRDIEISASELRAMRASEARRLNAPALDARQAKTVEARAVEDEVLYREALRLGLDQNDGIVRQRLIQKVLFLAEDLGGARTKATEAELRDYYARTPERWQHPAELHFMHVFARDPRTLEALQAGGTCSGAIEELPQSPPPFGEAFPLSRDVRARLDELGHTYGDDFVRSLLTLKPGTWSAPLASKLGSHLVLLLEKNDAGLEKFEDVRARVELAHLLARKQEATAKYLETAYPKYRITVDERPYIPSEVIARASNASREGED